MRILALTQMYPRPGADLFAPFNAQQFRQLARLHELRMIRPVPWTQRRLRDAVPTLRANQCLNDDVIAVEYPPFFFTPKFGHCYHGHFYLWSVRHTVRRAATEFRPDVILSCWAHPDGWAAVQLGRELGIPVVIKVIGSDVLVLARNLRRRRRVAEALSAADGVVTVSGDLACRVAGLGVDPRRIYVVSEGIDQDLFCPGDQTAARAALKLPVIGKRLLFVGNLLFSKGAGILLQACKLLRQRGVKFHCDVVGMGRDEQALRALSRQLELGEAVTFVGACSHSKLRDWYRATDLVVLPSFSEGIPNVLRESVMCGRGFVATNVGGIPEITLPSLGRLVEPGEPLGLAEAISQALVDPIVVNRQTALETNISWAESARLISEKLRSVLPLGQPD